MELNIGRRVECPTLTAIRFFAVRRKPQNEASATDLSRGGGATGQVSRILEARHTRKHCDAS